MATREQVTLFIEQVAPIIQKYAKEYGYRVVSPIISQACNESQYGTSWISKAPYFNLFGMKTGAYWKGRSVSATTKEEYVTGTLTTIRDNFRAYDSLEDGIRGYFEFISSKRYANLKEAENPKEYLEFIKADGYATSSSYVNTNMMIIEKYDLTQYDDIELEETKKTLKFNPTWEQTLALQKMLNSHGFYDELGRPLVEDGIIGPKTTFALKNFCKLYLES